MVRRRSWNSLEGAVATVLEVDAYGRLLLQRNLDGSFERGNFIHSSEVALPGGPLGFTLLHAAAALKCSAPVISALLEGQSAAATDALGRTPLAVAVGVRYYVMHLMTEHIF